jgi:hypothetical protein
MFKTKIKIIFVNSAVVLFYYICPVNCNCFLVSHIPFIYAKTFKKAANDLVQTLKKAPNDFTFTLESFAPTSNQKCESIVFCIFHNFYF